MRRSSAVALVALTVVAPDPVDAAALDREGCDTVLERLRELDPQLTPTPDAGTDRLVRGWFEVAEEAFFECPPRTGDIDSFDDAYAEMTRFEAEVDVGLLVEIGGS